MDIGEQEARRADNQIWNAAGAYGFATGSRGYEPNGEASLYFNTAIGLVRQLYDYKKLELLFTALERHSGGELQSELLWLGLERCAYLRCRDARPALDSLRRDYAERQLQQDFSVNSEQDRLKIGWFRRALGLPSEESDREKQILDALEFDPDWDAEAIQTRMEQIVLKSLNNVVNRTIAAVKRRFRGVREPQHIGHLDRLYRRRPHKLKNGILDAGADIVLCI